MSGIELIDRIFDKFIETGFSDLHIGEKTNFMRDKVGDLRNLGFSIPHETLLIFAQQNLIAEKYETLLQGDEVDLGYSYKGHRFRINFYYDINGLNVAIRTISDKTPTFEEIGLPQHLKSFYLKNKGLILVTGPTGSGKSTTLASIVNYIAQNRKCHILTLEDPIEYVTNSQSAMVHQREVGSNTRSWTNGIKYALRQDPDVIVVGEMRDLATIEGVLTLVETGHLVLSTLHTIDSVQTITRIINSFPEAQQGKIALQLSMVLELVVSQRLMPMKNGKGKFCAREILINNTAVANLIRTMKIPMLYSVLETNRKSGMITMDHSLAQAVVDGLLDINEAYYMVKDTQTFKQTLEFYQKQKQGNLEE